MTPVEFRACRRAGARLDRMNAAVPRAADEAAMMSQAEMTPGFMVAVMIFGLAVAAGLVWAAHCCLP